MCVVCVIGFINAPPVLTDLSITYFRDSSLIGGLNRNLATACSFPAPLSLVN